MTYMALARTARQSPPKTMRKMTHMALVRTTFRSPPSDSDEEEDQHGDNEDCSSFFSLSSDDENDQCGDRGDFSSFPSSSDDGGEYDESGDTEDDLSSSSDEEEDKDNKPPPFLHWDWSFLDKCKGRMAQLPDLHLLACVREYLLTVYGTMIAIHGKARLLCIPEAWRYPEFENARLLGARGFPDQGGYCPGWNDVGRWSGWSKPLVSLMATAGLDLLTSTLTSRRRAFRKFMRNFEKEVKHKRPIVRYTDIGPSSRFELGRDSRWTFDSPWHCGGLMSLYRQRAWPLFDDDRLYPGSGGLPSAREYWGLYSERGYSITGIGTDAGSSDYDEDDDAAVYARGELISYGAILYPSISAKLVPFWHRAIVSSAI
ncbi:hypothetical protein QBC33DRAFT_281643 [Phialemonium atrogriseum]|uniref:Uncharacterized protein n=1 Tax=Phialemonium atrogriseum TaxID=1093897 RepID=A0AAJ0BT10_9PEZI|nr:uncharacterized protein QBC33DRAFT_281643 [Phialemonium atrogriseum]KAK1762502.1 hypothetical protein QBC33DRAFT_281643 [Phialemonium atrogriseum]